MSVRLRHLIPGFAALILSWPAAAPLAGELAPVRNFEVSGVLKDDSGNLAADISGIACAPPATDGKAKCLVINDEDKAAQALTLDHDRLVVGDKVRLIGDGPAANIVGKAPANPGCSDGQGKFKDLDGEGLAFAHPFFYVVGSHGCSRGKKKENKGKFHLSSFILARIAADDIGKPGTDKPDNLARVATTFRLSEILGRPGEIGAQFTKDLQDDNGVANGLNIEGIVIDGTTLYVGLRAPSLDKRAFVISTPVEDLFSAAVPSEQLKATVVPLELGERVGIRDLALLRPGLLLILSGPAQEQTSIPYALHTVDMAAGNKLTTLGTLQPVVEGDKQGKAEALLVLAADADRARVVVLFDSLPNGGAREYSVPLR
jgi:hypothetical protein